MLFTFIFSMLLSVSGGTIMPGCGIPGNPGQERAELETPEFGQETVLSDTLSRSVLVTSFK